MLSALSAVSNSLACPNGWQVYTAEAGDQCWTIVYNSQNMTPEDFLEANPSIDCTAIVVGPQVCVASVGGQAGSPSSPSQQTVPGPTSPSQGSGTAPTNTTGMCLASFLILMDDSSFVDSAPRKKECTFCEDGNLCLPCIHSKAA